LLNFSVTLTVQAFYLYFIYLFNSTPFTLWTFVVDYFKISYTNFIFFFSALKSELPDFRFNEIIHELSAANVKSTFPELWKGTWCCITEKLYKNLLPTAYIPRLERITLGKSNKHGMGFALKWWLSLSLNSKRFLIFWLITLLHFKPPLLQYEHK